MVNLRPWRKQAVATARSEKEAGARPKWNLGILSDPETDEVPGTRRLPSELTPN
jgi:hypothetical protein